MINQTRKKVCQGLKILGASRTGFLALHLPKSAISWVTQRTGAARFVDVATEMTSTWTQRLTMDSSMFSSSPTPEPDSIAWNFVNAYFEESDEIIYGVVYRPDLESNLRAYFRGELTLLNDSAGQALRNTVYASGCRIYLAKNSDLGFQDLQRLEWMYFPNDLAELTKVLFTANSLLSIRAIMTMTFAGGLGCPSPEYLLCANALRVAQAKGLHRQPARDWNMSENEAIYDDYITCHIPEYVLKQLLSVKGQRQSPALLLEMVMDLDSQLCAWRDSLPKELQLADDLKSFQIDAEARPGVKMAVHYEYYCTLIYIHIIIVYPWISSTSFGQNDVESFRAQIRQTSDVVHSCARNILIMAKGLEIKPNTTKWAAFYVPMLGLINLLFTFSKTLGTS
ncbi:uncharacterized protein Z519_04652 [Cladophialophora bantiana CBS 173.52]|uniref:Uncharacterized protein n=1 Tax=Cladophialophora bantiana (strain ATCC 10958 / CBS 173.52 / CDC B-1940 / NIH 8579) TaxID=1442370 RepID=A0A0D2HUX6_CLAB1|nr:uncharacterized protein Z519_04652 [Cladophialophora bantiana CBS 173.52]KIW94675.1 hypothetical protein Z519_04652 [Cladophialophora bantiana CBS 173.52]